MERLYPYMKTLLRELGTASSLSDSDVIERVRSGETALFEILMRRHNTRIYRTVLAILGNDAEAEDVMQQAYISAFVHLDQFGGRALFSTWMTKIAVHEALARLRRGLRGLHPALTLQEDDEAMTPLVALQQSPEEDAMTAEMRSILEEEIASLSLPYRSVLLLRDVEGLSTEETAGVLEVSEAVVKTRLHRARALMRERLFQRAGSGLHDLFPFPASRCDRVVAGFFATLSNPEKETV